MKESFLSSKTDNILVLGGNGFLGKAFVMQLVSRGYYNITVFDRFSSGKEQLNHKSVTNIKGDYQNTELLNQVLLEKDIVINFLSYSNPRSTAHLPLRDISENLVANVNLIELLVQNDITKYVYPSSAGTIYGETNAPARELDTLNPQSPYGISKASLEYYLNYFKKTYNFDFIVLRYSNPYGLDQIYQSSQGVITTFLKKAFLDEQVDIFGSVHSTRDYIYVNDAMRMSVALLEKQDLKNHVFNISSGVSTSLEQIIELIEMITGNKLKTRLGEQFRSEVNHVAIDNTLVTDLLDWECLSLREGMAQIYNQLCTYYKFENLPVAVNMWQI